jgi:predicted enzyme related to lactoylglutathione lyase
MITHLHSAGIPVKDQDAALAFYVDTLGWEKRNDADMGTMRFLTVAPKGAQTELSLVQATEGDTVISAITLIADDVQATHDELAAKGVQINMPVTDMPWGARGMEFQDPDGNRFFLSTAS